MWGFSDQDLSETKHQEHDFTPCITSPFSITNPPLPPAVSSATPSPSLSRREKPRTRKNLLQWLKLQEIHHRIKDCETEEDKCDLYISLGDRFCDVGKFTDALCSYGQAFFYTKNDIEDFGFEAFVYFMQVISKVIESETINQMRMKKGIRKNNATNQENEPLLQNLKGQPVQHYLALASDPCSDPLSCPSCSGVLFDPVTIACGHTFCRQHVMSNTVNSSLCLKCKAPWRKEEPRLMMSASGALERQTSNPLDDLKAINTNTLINNLVQKYWSPDLAVIGVRNRANKLFSSGQFSQAIELYDKAFSMDPEDHLVLSNRSVSKLRLGNPGSALDDADLAAGVKPDWPKAHLRRANALKVMGNHEEAFKAYFACLVLEGGVAKPVKQELAKQLYSILKHAANLVGSSGPHSLSKDDSGSILSGSSASNSSSNSLCDLDSFKASDLPVCLKDLAHFLDQICDIDQNDPTEDLLEDKLEPHEEGKPSKWLNGHQQLFKRPYRQLASEALDSNDYECPLCMRMLWKPITTPCGHTFCKTCLDRVLDHNTCCPMCKSATLKMYLSERRETVINEFVEHLMKNYMPTEYSERMKINENEMQQLAGQTGESTSGQVPVFVCTIGFPNIPCPLHVFEPRYRLMIRRCMEVGTREFGMCCSVDSSEPFAKYGTMLEIRDIQFFPDGRSIVDTMGGRRFKVLERNILDGYNVAKVEFLEDEKVADNELHELTKLHDETLQQTKDWFGCNSETIQKEIVGHYGKLPDTEQDYWDLPNGPTWLWWILNTLPIDPQLKLLLLSMTSLKKRLENTRRILLFLAKAKTGKKNK